MKLIDSCVWIELMMNSPTGRNFTPFLQQPEQLLVSTLVLYEVSKWLARSTDRQSAQQVMVTLQSGRVVQPNSSIAFHAAELSITHQLHAMDALIYATALEHDAELVTCDAHFKSLPQVSYTAKAQAA